MKTTAGAASIVLDDSTIGISPGIRPRPLLPHDLPEGALMSPTFLRTLKPGTPYRVTMKGHRSTLRIFKYLERRWKSIPCAVFTSRVQGPLTIEVLGKGRLRLSGKHVPRSEWSIPHYDLERCEEASIRPQTTPSAST